jgi:coenzyme F420-reducing hydrogenase gamma subunit
MVNRPSLAVWKFASCDGCQLTLLDCEDELLAVVGVVDIAYFLEATRATVAGPYDVSLVEGSITTPGDAERIRQIRADSRFLVTIGACATSGGVQALRNFADVREYAAIVYADPRFVATLDRSSPIAEHVAVDLELRGCPIDKRQLLETIGALLVGRRPDLPTHSVCVECKQAGHPCVLVSEGAPCLGPVTQAGCGALCPGYRRACFGCFGPAESAETEALIGTLLAQGHAPEDIERLFRTFNVGAPAFAEAARSAAARVPVPVTLSPRPEAPK